MASGHRSQSQIPARSSRGPREQCPVGSGTRTRTIANTSKTGPNKATGKITGEERYWSRTDLWDFQANIDGALVAFEGLRPLLRDRDPALESHIAAKFAKVQALLDAQREGEGFKTYDKLNRAEVKELSDAASAPSESGCPSWPPRSSENQKLDR